MKRLQKSIESTSKITWIKKNIIVAFEGNDDINSTKGEDHYRRGKGGCSASVNIKNPEAKPTYSKQSFLKNRHNKMQLKNLLKPAFVKAGITLNKVMEM